MKISEKTKDAPPKKIIRDVNSWPPLPLEINDTATKRTFRVGKIIGQGGFARCYLCTDLTSGVKFCCKAIYDPDSTPDNLRQQFVSEQEILINLHHTNVMGYFGSFKVGLYLCLILEYCGRGTVMDLLKKKQLTEENARYLAHQMIDGLKYLHSKNILHRDLKLANLLLAEGPNGQTVLKLGDFGLAARLDRLSGTVMKTFCGTPKFMAPEVVNRKVYVGYGFPSDIWSFGVVFYCMLVGKVPFSSDNREDLFKMILSCNVVFPEESDISPSARDLILSIFRRNPSERPTPSQILMHSFFKKTIIQSPVHKNNNPLFKKPAEFNAKPLYSKPGGISAKLTTICLDDYPPEVLKRKRTPLPSTQLEPSIESETVVPPLLAQDTSSNNTETLPATAPKKSFFSQWLSRITSLIDKELVECKPEQPNLPVEDLTLDHPVNYVIEWSEDSELRYRLGDGTCGILCKDHSILLWLPILGEVYYDLSSYQCYPSCELPEPLISKGLALDRARSLLTSIHLSTVSPSSTTKPHEESKILATYVTRFFRTSQETLFSLSNQLIQMNFLDDHVTLLLNSSESSTSITLLLPNRPPMTRRLGLGHIIEQFPEYFKLRFRLERLLLALKFLFSRPSPSSID